MGEGLVACEIVIPGDLQAGVTPVLQSRLNTKSQYTRQVTSSRGAHHRRPIHSAVTRSESIPSSYTVDLLKEPPSAFHILRSPKLFECVESVQ